MSYVSNSSDLPSDPEGFTYIAAPRTAAGYFKNGSMILLQVGAPHRAALRCLAADILYAAAQVDGQEDIEWGPNLFEVAELLVSLGVEGAVNLDGGGSSVSVLHGQYIDLPTSSDVYPEVQERAVASFACVRNS